MPNNQIDPRLARSLGNAFGGSPSAPAQQPSAPPPPSSDGSGGGSSLMGALTGLLGGGQPNHAAQPVDPTKQVALMKGFNGVR